MIKKLQIFWMNSFLMLPILTFHNLIKLTEHLKILLIQSLKLLWSIGPIRVLLQSKKTVLLNLILISRLLQSNKATQNNDSPTKLNKDNVDIFVNITPVHKKAQKLKNSKSSQDNYITCQYLSNISKAYKNFMFRQMSEYFESFLSKYQCELRKEFSAQQCLLLIYCLWFKISGKLSIKSQTKDQNKLWFQLLGNFIWGTSGVHIRTFINQHFIAEKTQNYLDKIILESNINFFLIFMKFANQSLISKRSFI